MKKVSVLLLLISFFSCKDKPLPDKKINNIVRIMMHEPHSFTLFTQDTSQEIKTVFVQIPIDPVYITDVKNGEKNWAIIKQKENGTNLGQVIYFELILHIKSIEDINGAGWNHGKFGKGQTVIIQ